jgi:glucokinase
VADPVAVGLDVGGTKLVAASVTADGTIVDRRRIATPRGDTGQLLDTLVGLVHDVGPDLPLGVGIAGIIDRHGTMRYAPNLGLTDVALVPLLRDALGTDVVIANDASVAVYGEYRAGAGAGIDDLLMVTLGTGVGGGVVVAGRLLQGANGFATELGHIIVQEGGRLCPCGNAGCLEAYASGTAIGLRGAILVNDPDEPTVMSHYEAIDGKAVTRAAIEGDALAQRILAEAGHWLGVGLASLVNAFDPGRVLVGGGASVQAAPWILPAAAEAMNARIMGAPHRGQLPDVVLAELGDDAGTIGAALLALDGDAA